MPLFGLSWGSSRRRDEDDDQDEDDDDEDAEYESYTDDDEEEEDDVDEVDDTIDHTGNEAENDGITDPKENGLCVVSDNMNNLSHETNDSNEEMLERQEFTELLQQLPPDSPEKKDPPLTAAIYNDGDNGHISKNIESRDNENDLTTNLRRNIPNHESHNPTQQVHLSSSTTSVTSNTNTIDPPIINEGESTTPTESPPPLLTNQNLYELQNLLFLAIEADRVDIVQELLLPSQPSQSPSDVSSSSSSSSSFNMREYLLNPLVRVTPPESMSNETNEVSNVTISFLDSVNATNLSIEEMNSPNYCCTTIPPIHIAMYYGSINALNYLLRTGANPALRPNVPYMNQCAQINQTETQPDIPFVLDVPHIQHYDQCTAWEVAFGRRQLVLGDVDVGHDNNNNNNKHTSNTGNSNAWSLFGTSNTTNINGKGGNQRNSNLTASKLESIRHAFFTEAIRCISTDDVQRLQQLHQAGMPIDDNDDDDRNNSTISSNGKKQSSSSSSASFTFTKWCHDFHAHKCLQYITNNTLQSNVSSTTSEPTSSSSSSSSDMNGHSDTNGNAIIGRKLPMVSKGLVSLQNRYEELDALCRSLSACLDNVAEEVSVGAGLLLSSNSNSSGAQALASHVRTVKHQREQLLDEYERYQDTYQNSLDELLYYIQQYNINYNTNGKVPAEIHVEEIDDWWEENIKNMKRGPKVTVPPPNTPDAPATLPPSAADMIDENDDQLREKEQHMITQIMILETKIRRIRATISDLSDDNQRNQEEIERRQLMVGLQYIRTLRNEIRDVEYQIYELKQYDIECRTKIRTIQNCLATSMPTQQQTNDNGNVSSTVSTVLPSPGLNKGRDNSAPNMNETRSSNNMVKDEMGSNGYEKETDHHPNQASSNLMNSSNTDDAYDSTQRDYTTTMVVHGPTRGFLSLNLWQILLRIIGMGGGSSSSSHNGRTNHSNVATRSSAVDQNRRSSSDPSTTRPVIII